MNRIDKFSVDFEIWWNGKILRKNPEKTLQLLLRMFAKENHEQIDYILEKFQKHKCQNCQGMGHVSFLPKGFLNNHLQSHDHMSTVIEELTPTSTILLSQYTKFGRIPDRQIEKLEGRITREMIIPIIQTKNKIDEIITDADIESFMVNCLNLTRLLHKKYPLRDLAKKDLQSYEACISIIEKADWLSVDNRKMATEIAEILIEYSNRMTPLLLEKQDVVKQAVIQINQNDMRKSLYGSLLALLCIMSMISFEHLRHSNINVFTHITNQGYRLARNLYSYIELLGVLTNTKELKFSKLQNDVVVSKDLEKEFIEIDINKIEVDKLYLVQYQDEMYAVRKTDQNHIAFYDVI